MSLSSSAILDWHHCNFPWYFDWRHFPPKVYGRGRFDLPHKQQDYILRPCESICWISPCLINLARRPIEDITCMLFGYLALNEQLAFVGALETCWRDRTYCSHRGIDETIRSLQKLSAWFHINFSLAHTSTFSRSIEDFGLHDKIAPSDFNARFLVFS